MRHQWPQTAARHNKQHAGGIHFQREPAQRPVRGANLARGIKGQALNRPFQTRAAPRHRHQRKQGNHIARRHVERECGRPQNDHLPLCEQDAGPVRMHQQRMKRRQLMIHPPAAKPHTNHHRCRHMTKCLVEIGRVLFTDPVLSRRGDLRQRIGGHAVHVTDHCGRPAASGKGSDQTAVNRHTYLREG